VLGIGWAVLQPLLFLAAYWALLEILGARHPGTGDTEAKLVTLLAGLVPWLFVARSITSGLGALPSHANLVKQVNFPTAVLPFASVGVPGIDFAVGIVVLLAASIAAGLASSNLLLLVPTVVLLSATLVGLAGLLAPLAVMLPDVRRVAAVGLRVGLFLTPVLYVPASLPDGWEPIAYLNPVAYFISLLRYAVTGFDEVLVLGLEEDLAVAAALTLVLAIAALITHRRTWRTVIDHV
jgi:lipopolysaccharide transport system permease protein